MESKRRRELIRWFVAAGVLLPLLLIFCLVFYVLYKDWGKGTDVSWLEIPAGCEIEANRTVYLCFWPEGYNKLARVRCPYDPVTALEKFKAAFKKEGAAFQTNDYESKVDLRPVRPADLAIRSGLRESLKKGLYDARQQRPDGALFMRLSEKWYGMDELIFFAWPTTDGSVVEIIEYVSQ